MCSIATVVALAGALVVAQKKPAPYSQRLASSFIARKAPIDAGYGPAVLWEGIARAGAQAAATKGDESLLKAAEAAVSSLVSEDGTLDGWDPDWYSLDDLRIGNNLLYFYQRNKDAKLKVAADGLRQQLNRWPRTPSGGFWHRAPIYEDQMWLDGIYMADTFYATYTHLFEKDNTTAWEEIALQFDLIEEHTRNHTSNLLVHGYDEAKDAVWADPVTGASPLVWNRAVGWYFMALVETLQVYPRALPGYDRLLEYFVTLADGLARSQDKKGGWWLIMNEGYEKRKGNYIESSATAMFSYGLLRGVRDGLLDVKYQKVGLKAYKLLTKDFIRDDKNGSISFLGTVQVGSLNSNASFEYYTSIPVVENDTRGSGSFIFAAIEEELI
ncbi:Unsaturated rhamnogalacturonyl hydrolase YteR [Colletotrichum orbiculare MAFF 240422]|uniref:Unsaturated rhamnogalacturonyl hydrolase YteR n=1 Tax=Colletotrichum orbiculare (strain 104-T / ATCC 96160 / CBS 514.97 / LARS 414 / MAFF 240422) TaxID=1213857 RepID=N4V951_COLOR|nr:Unsaturated rhamnogalacturonyl hydrolase YteR [Colletotrichum orbiculare MAFF 240422]